MIASLEWQMMKQKKAALNAHLRKMGCPKKPKLDHLPSQQSLGEFHVVLKDLHILPIPLHHLCALLLVRLVCLS